MAEGQISYVGAGALTGDATAAEVPGPNMTDHSVLDRLSLLEGHAWQLQQKLDALESEVARRIVRLEALLGCGEPQPDPRP